MSEPIPYGIIYLTSRIFRGEVVKKYVGLHTLRNGVIEDGYLGSGKVLRQAIRKYGRGAFIRETLEVCYSRKELNTAEVKWINTLDAIRNPLFYNLAEGGSSTANLNRKPVYQFTLEGGFIAEHASVSAAAALAGCSEAQMTLTCKSNRRTAANCQWRFKREGVVPVSVGVTRTVYCYDLDGKFIEVFFSLTKAAAFVGQTSTANIAAVCSGKKRTCGGYRWSYTDVGALSTLEAADRGQKAVAKIDPDTGEILCSYTAARHAAFDLNVSPGNICRAIKYGGRCGGFKWIEL